MTVLTKACWCSRRAPMRDWKLMLLLSLSSCSSAHFEHSEKPFQESVAGAAGTSVLDTAGSSSGGAPPGSTGGTGSVSLGGASSGGSAGAPEPDPCAAEPWRSGGAYGGYAVVTNACISSHCEGQFRAFRCRNRGGCTTHEPGGYHDWLSWWELLPDVCL